MSNHSDEGPHGFEMTRRGPQRRCTPPLVEFRDKFAKLVNRCVSSAVGTNYPMFGDRIRSPWLAVALAGKVGVEGSAWSTIDVLGGWIDWAIEHEKDGASRKRIGSFAGAIVNGHRWHSEIRLWLEKNRPLWAEATLAAEVYCGSKRERVDDVGWRR